MYIYLDYILKSFTNATNDKTETNTYDFSHFYLTNEWTEDGGKKTTQYVDAVHSFDTNLINQFWKPEIGALFSQLAHH